MSSRLPAPVGFIKPEIPTLAPDPPSGEGWIHEIKHDGYRTLIVIDDSQAVPSLATAMTGQRPIGGWWRPAPSWPAKRP